jgi:hypothetical protein
MHFTVELPSGLYLASIFTDGAGTSDHQFRIFHHHNDLRLAEVAEAVLKVVRAEYLHSIPEDVKTARIVLVRDSLWAALNEHLRQMAEQEGINTYMVSFMNSHLYGVRDHAELAITFMNLTNLPKAVEAGLDGLMEDPTEGALVSVLSCLEMVRQYADREDSSPDSLGIPVKLADRFAAEMASVMASRVESN